MFSAGILDVTGFAVHAILSIDHEVWPGAARFVFIDDLIDASRIAEPSLRAGPYYVKPRLHGFASERKPEGAGLGRNNRTDRYDLSVAQAATALRWWRETGVEFVLDESPRDHFATAAAPGDATQPASPRTSEATPKPRPAGNTPRSAEYVAPAPSADALTWAKELAASAADLAALRSSIERFEGCALKKTATQLVFADGAPGSRVMLVGEAPGADEDRIGRPFVGRAGQLLDRMLAAVGLDRTQVYIANVVPWRPPGNRTPTQQETQTCLPFIKRQIELAQPEILVCLGASAAQTLLGIQEGITRARGRWFEYHHDDGRFLRAVAMLHPAYLLRQPAQKRNAWTDLRALAKELRS